MRFPTYKQPDSMDCGPTCIRIIAKYYGKNISLSKLRQLTETTRTGSNLKDISDAAEVIGFNTVGIKLSLEQLAEGAPFPCIAYWNQNHFVVIYKIRKGKVYISDPALGLVSYSQDEFLAKWIAPGATASEKEGIVLVFEPTSRLKELKEDADHLKGLNVIIQYILQQKSLLKQLFISLGATSLLELIIPFLTQGIVDTGIKERDIGFIYLVLIAQLMLFLGKAAIEVIRSWIVLYLSTRINISMVSDFFKKLMSLPIAFFDVKMTGDLMQRISDNKRIETLLTTSSLNIIFSLFSLVIFSAVLAYYNLLIFLVFIVGSLLYITWIILFLGKRKELDYKNFSQISKEQSKVIELISGMQEIKLHNAERQKRGSWERIQAELFTNRTKSLVLDQYQQVGSDFINEVKNIIIIIISARLVIDGELTLGMMLSISYIIGQMNGPVQQFVSLIQSLQDARISLERLDEIHSRSDEEIVNSIPLTSGNEGMAICITNVSFRYLGSSNLVLDNVNFTVPANKITAIVGASGSGKTTLMKLLLRFYVPLEGEIKIGEHNLNSFSHSSWREKCGTVMQEGYIFNDTIANNIAVGEEKIDEEKLFKAVEIAKIREFIEDLPLNYNTIIGQEGVGMSSGQKQRILIARAVYKNPSYIFFDEATSAIDTKNENVIMSNLQKFFEGRTSIIIAHRLSTVKNADQIVVLDEGKVVEIGTHLELIEKGGHYFSLIQNQLELGGLSHYEG